MEDVLLVDKEITREDFSAWKNDHVTKMIFNQIRMQTKFREEVLTDGSLFRNHATDVAVRETTRLQGMIEAWKFLLNAEFEDEEVEEDTPDSYY